MVWTVYVLSPVLIHLVISEGVTFFAGDILDSAACTALSAFLVLPAVIWMYRQETDLRLAGNSKHETYKKEKHLGCYAVCFLSGGLLNVIWSGVLFGLGISSAFSNQTQEALLGSQMAAQITGPGILVPISEELVFRGLVYERMKTRLSVRWAVFFSSLLFALYHGNPIQMIYAFPMALLLALLCERGGSLSEPILFHMGANLTAIVFSLLS
ncbi:MAG: CPBP family intramembrane metalloprotease [Lachnospiraceae bacterium]|nr:CPBP family intramembrane metalloprotease [Lachnospiraceae bacterium]